MKWGVVVEDEDEDEDEDDDDEEDDGRQPRRNQMAAHHIYIDGFVEEKWEAKIGVVANPDVGRRAQRVVVKGGLGETTLATLLPRLEREAVNRNNERGVSR